MTSALIPAPSPNHDARTAPPSLIVLHYTGMPTGEEALLRLVDADAKVSAHYLLEEDGRIFALVPEERRAWHAGVSFWDGISNVNAASIGIEIVNPGHDWGYRPFPAVQIDSLLSLLSGITQRHAIQPYNIIGHSDVAPARKQDPGELFPWQLLAERGFGLWPESGLKATQPLTALLSEYGYDTTIEHAAARAFARHFAPAQLDTLDPAVLAPLAASLLQQKRSIDQRAVKS